MEKSYFLFAGLMLLSLGLAGCSQGEEDMSSRGESSFTEWETFSSVARLTQQLRAYNASLGMSDVTTRMSRGDKIRIGVNDAFGAIRGYLGGGGIRGAIIGGAVASIKAYNRKNFFPSVGGSLSDDWKTSTVISLNDSKRVFADSIGYYHNMVEDGLYKEGFYNVNHTTSEYLDRADVMMTGLSIGYRSQGNAFQQVKPAISSDIDRMSSIDNSLPFDEYCGKLKEITPSASDHIDFVAEYLYQMVYGNVDDAEEYTPTSSI